MISVLYDGWPLIYEPESLSTMHLMTLLAYIPPQVNPVVALPAPAPSWLPDVTTLVKETPNNSLAKLVWEQKILPGLSRKLNIQLLHLTTKNIPFVRADISVISPAIYDFLPGHSYSAASSSDLVPRNLSRQADDRFIDRIRAALSQGGLVRARTVFWPEDIAGMELSLPITPLPPAIPPGFLPKKPESPQIGFHDANIELPDAYILYHGPFDTRSIYRLLKAWSWAAGPIGEQFPLLLLGVSLNQRRQIESILAKTDFGTTIQFALDIPPPIIPVIYQNCSALIHPTEASPWDGPIRFAMVCGKPIISVESPMVKAIVGPAAYLAPMDDDRTIGAGIISVIVEEEFWMNLAEAARKRSAAWISKDFSESLLTAYQQLAEIK
ncbi:MAG: glycosyltransferase [Anaerolineales bacterium]|nr:glycosyltransferase [Anaerolineales bacterium]